MPSLSKMRHLSREHARRFVVRRHMLAPPRALPPSAESVLAVARRFGSLQFDPIDVPGARNHDLVLHARVAGYERAWCDGWLYGPERRLVEVYNKSLNLVPVDELPWHRLAWERAAQRHATGILAEGRTVARAVLDRIAREGAAGTAAVAKEHDAQVTGYWGTPTSEGRAALDALFETGRIGIARRDGNRKHFDLMERLVPRDVLTRVVPHEESVRHRVLSRHRAMGLLGASGSAELWVGIGDAAARRAATQRLVRDGALAPVTVEGVRGERYVLGDEVALLDETAQPATTAPAATLVAPLDPIVWDRKLLSALWDFDYTWEIYTPVAKREYGCYVLPLLYGDRFVGRIEPRFDRQHATLAVLDAWFEPWFAERDDDHFARSVAAALAALARFAGAERVALPRRRTGFWRRLRVHLP